MHKIKGFRRNLQNVQLNIGTHEYRSNRIFRYSSYCLQQSVTFNTQTPINIMYHPI